MILKLIERSADRTENTNEMNTGETNTGETNTGEVLHECATCHHKNRVYLSAPTGTQTAAVWRCGKLSQKTQREVLVQPHENCFEHRSLSDYWEQTNLMLVR